LNQDLPWRSGCCALGRWGSDDSNPYMSGTPAPPGGGALRLGVCPYPAPDLTASARRRLGAGKLVVPSAECHRPDAVTIVTAMGVGGDHDAAATELVGVISGALPSRPINDSVVTGEDADVTGVGHLARSAGDASGGASVVVLRGQLRDHA
jgi:hypothetical protein